MCSKDSGRPKIIFFFLKKKILNNIKIQEDRKPFRHRLFATPWTVPSFSVCEISQARTLDWVAVSTSRDLCSPGTKPMAPTTFPALQAGSSLPSHQEGPFKCYTLTIRRPAKKARLQRREEEL